MIATDTMQTLQAQLEKLASDPTIAHKLLATKTADEFARTAFECGVTQGVSLNEIDILEFLQKNELPAQQNSELADDELDAVSGGFGNGLMSAILRLMGGRPQDGTPGSDSPPEPPTSLPPSLIPPKLPSFGSY